MSTHVLNFLLQVRGGPPVSPLKYHMLEKVSSPIGVLRIKSGTGINPNSNSGGLGCQIGLGGNPQAVGKSSNSSFRSREDVGVISKEGMRRGVVEEPRVSIPEPLDLGFDLFG
ncbi:unnamed protein product [Rhodiola kirilowii]